MSVISLPNSGLGWDYRQSHNAPIPGAIGGYEHGGAQYLFLYQGSEFGVGDSHIHALKSTDLGVTWTDTGNINIPQIAGIDPFAAPTYTTCMDGDTVYLMAVDLDGTNSGADPHTGPILLWKYDLVSNTFSTSSISGAPTVWKSWAGTTFSPRSGICLHLLLRGPGDMLLLYTDVESIGGNKWARLAVATFNGSSCGTGILLAGQAGAANAFTERCATLDASHNLHVILAGPDSSLWYHVAMSPIGGFGTFQTVETNAWFTNDTSNLLDFPAPSDTIAFLGVRNRTSANPNGDLALYVAPGGSLSPAWTFHNLPPVNAIPDPVIAPDWIGALGYMNGTLHAFWTQTGIPPSWSVSGKMGEIRTSTAAVIDLTTWTPEISVMGPFDSGTLHWGAAQVAVWPGPSIGLGVLGNFEGFDSAGSGDPIEISRLTTVPPSGTTPLSVTCGSVPDGIVGVAYSHTFPATGGTAPYTFSIITGTLPPGLVLAGGTGTVSGIPTTAGAYPITLQVTDAASATDTANCSITIHGDTLGLGCAQPPNGVVGLAYDYTFPVSGGIPPFTFSIISGILPPGLTLDAANGEVSGTPTLAGDFAFTIEVDDAFGSVTGHCDILITVTEVPGPGITCDSPPGGQVGVAYDHTFPVTGIPPGATVSYSITAGALPPGLTLNTATGEVTGTPTTAGHYSFTITLSFIAPAVDVLMNAAGAPIYRTGGDTILVT